MNNKVQPFKRGRPFIYKLNDLKFGEEKKYPIENYSKEQIHKLRCVLRASALYAGLRVSCSAVAEAGFLVVRRIK